MSICAKATGVSDVNEVIQKMVSQESTAESLMILTKENQVLYVQKKARGKILPFVRKLHGVE